MSTLPLAAEETATPAAIEQRFAEVSDRVCFRQATGEVSFGAAEDADTQLMNEVGVVLGLVPGVIERLGREGIGLVAQSVLGSQQVGNDHIVLAVGGRIPGCRAILLRNEASEVPEAGKSAAANLAALGWTEVSATNPPGSGMLRRMFLRRGASGQPVLLNLYAGTVPDSDIFLVSTVTPVPEYVTLPDGF
jgi:hypothetical protein